MDDAAAEAPAPRRAPHDKRGAILRAAAELFPRQGFDKTSMDSIAECAMVSKATVYAHFASKEVLFRTTLEALAHQSPNPWEALLNMRGPLPVRLLAIADAVVRMAASNALGDAAYGLVRPPALPSQIREEMWTLGFERYDATMRTVLARSEAGQPGHRQSAGCLGAFLRIDDRHAGQCGAAWQHVASTGRHAARVCRQCGGAVPARVSAATARVDSGRQTRGAERVLAAAAGQRDGWSAVCCRRSRAQSYPGSAGAARVDEARS